MKEESEEKVKARSRSSDCFPSMEIPSPSDGTDKWIIDSKFKVTEHTICTTKPFKKSITRDWEVLQSRRMEEGVGGWGERPRR